MAKLAASLLASSDKIASQSQRKGSALGVRLEAVKAGADSRDHFLKYCLFLFCGSGFLLLLSQVEIGLHQHFLLTRLDHYDPPQLPLGRNK